MSLTRVSFLAGDTGDWTVERITPVRGDGLAPARALQRIEGAELVVPSNGAWMLHGIRSNERYVETGEKNVSPPFSRGLDARAAPRGADSYPQDQRVVGSRPG